MHADLVGFIYSSIMAATWLGGEGRAARSSAGRLTSRWQVRPYPPRELPFWHDGTCLSQYPAKNNEHRLYPEISAFVRRRSAERKMTTLLNPPLSTLLKGLFADADVTDQALERQRAGLSDEDRADP